MSRNPGHDLIAHGEELAVTRKRITLATSIRYLTAAVYEVGGHIVNELALVRRSLEGQKPCSTRKDAQ